MGHEIPLQHLKFWFLQLMLFEIKSHLLALQRYNRFAAFTKIFDNASPLG